MKRIIDFILDGQMLVIVTCVLFLLLWPLIMWEVVESRFWVAVVPILYNLVYCFFFFTFIDSSHVQTYKVLKQPVYLNLVFVSFILVILIFALTVAFTSAIMFGILLLSMVLSIAALFYADSKYKRL